ncbi:unnamed protein product, partial [Sphacelaria rigidula]
MWTDGASQDGLANVGEIITLNFGILNAGDATLMNFCIIDTHLGDGCLECSATDSGSLAAGEILYCAFTYEIDQDDIDLGAVAHLAQVTAKSLAGTEVSAD